MPIPASVSVSPDTVVLAALADTAVLAARVRDQNGNLMAGVAVAWSSSAPDTVTVNAAGLVTAVADGAATITARAGEVAGSAVVTVRRAPASLSLTPDSLTLDGVGDTATVVARARDANGHDVEGARVTWASGDPTVAAVDSAGLVTAVSTGSAEVTATADGAEASVPVTVEFRAVSILLEPSELVFTALDDTATLTATVVDGSGKAGGGDAPVRWASGDGSVASVDSAGLVTAIRPGSTEVTAMSGSLAASARVEVFDLSSDRDVLEFLYHRTGGDGWLDNTNWLSGAPLSEWHGVVTDERGYVTELALAGYGLTGPLPPAIGNLIHLERLVLHANALSGTLPPAIGKLVNLEYLTLAENRFEGPIPPEIGDLARLDTLFLSYNDLSGPIPSEIGNLESLVFLALYNNRLTGPLPASLGRLKRLTDLSLADNRIGGPLPGEIGEMTSLAFFSIDGNQVSGSLPPELGKLKSLEFLSVNDNRMTGSIPSELAGMTSLKSLFLMRNGFSGTIPPELGSLSNLETLWLFQNELTGSIPPELADLASLVDLTIGANPLTGRIPPELGRLSALEVLSLGRSELSGPIPPELGRLPSLKSLHLCQSNVSGPIPPELGDIRTLETLYLCYNPELGGLLPRSLMNLEFLSQFLFYGTELCPQIDGEFQEWLVEVQARGRECDPAEVERLALDEFFAGTGGDSWTDRTGWDSGAPAGSRHGVTETDGRVSELALPANGLRGVLPPEIGNLTELRVLNLGENRLSGEFPVVIASMTELDTIRVGGNREMEGVLPFRLVELTGLETLAFANTGLCASPSGTFQSWLGGLRTADGPTCENPEQVTLSLPFVYLTQAIQRPEGDVPLIEGRDALLRTFLTSDESQAFFEPEVVATLSRGGREVHRAVMRRDGDVLATRADPGDLRSSYNAVIPSEYILPGTELVVEADPAGRIPLAPESRTRFPASGSWPLNVITVPPMEVTVVPVVEAEQPDSSIYEWTGAIGDDSPEVALLRDAFPFSGFRARSRETYVTSLDLTNENDQWGLVLELEAVRAAEDGRGYWYGAMSSVNGQVRGVARLGGWVSVGRPMEEELAHEVGHNLDLLHAPCGGALNADPEFPYANGSIGAWGYDFRNGTVMSPDRRRDIMGYCYGQSWLSDYYFEKVIDYRARLETRAARAVADAGPRSEMLVLWGGVVNGEPRIEPPFPMTTAARLPEEAGAYRLEGTGSGGRVEFSLAFAPGEDKFGNKYFFFTVPVEEDWAESLDRLTLTGPEGTVTVRAADERALSVVTDPATGRIRSILRDWGDVLPAAVGRADAFEVTTVRGLGEAVGLRR